MQVSPPCASTAFSTPLSPRLADDKGKFDEIVEQKGVRILIEPTAIMHILGTTIDYHQDKLK